MARNAPTLEEVLSAVLGGSTCPHEEMLGRVSLLLTAAALRHGGQMEFTESELRDASLHALAVTGLPGARSILVETPHLPVEQPATRATVHAAPRRTQ